MVYLYNISCLRCTILVGNPQCIVEIFHSGQKPWKCGENWCQLLLQPGNCYCFVLSKLVWLSHSEFSPWSIETDSWHADHLRCLAVERPSPELVTLGSTPAFPGPVISVILSLTIGSLVAGLLVAGAIGLVLGLVGRVEIASVICNFCICTQMCTQTHTRVCMHAHTRARAHWHAHLISLSLSHTQTHRASYNLSVSLEDCYIANAHLAQNLTESSFKDAMHSISQCIIGLFYVLFVVVKLKNTPLLSFTNQKLEVFVEEGSEICLDCIYLVCYVKCHEKSGRMFCSS